jgi:hypothetical protein
MGNFKELDLVMLPKGGGSKMTNIYITSDEEIEDGDWFVTGIPTVGKSIHKYAGKCGDFIIGNDDFYCFKCFSKKIIATTDLLITVHRVNSDSDRVPTIPQSFVNYFVEQYNKGNVIEKVMVEYKEEKKEEVSFIKCMSNIAYGPVFDTLKINDKNEITIQQIKETYTREEVVEFGLKCLELGMDLQNNPLPRLLEISGKDYYNKWLEEKL